MQRLYGHITDQRITEFEGEATELLRQGYLETVTYGFKRDESWIEPTLRYTASELANSGTDDDPGRVRPGINISGASFHSYLTYNAAWWALSHEQRETIKGRLPLQRIGQAEPSVNGYFADDKTYSSGGRSLGRASVRSY